MISTSRFLFGFICAATIGLLAVPNNVSGCPFCGAQGQTFLGEANQAHLILFGTLTDAQRDPDEFGKGSTTLNIEVVVKDHEIRGDRKKIVIPRYVPTEQKFLVFCEVYQGKLDPYRGVAVPEDSNIAEYLKGAIALKDKPLKERLAYFFKYLADPDQDISNDALTEFGNADYADYRPLAETVDPDLIAGWLKKNPPASRIGLYGSMLGHCGTDQHAALLKELLDEAKAKRRFTGIDGVLAGYILLKPQEGWDYLRAILKDSKQEFLLRYAGLRTVRFFWEFRPDVKSREEMVDTVMLLLDQSDIADLPIDDLRKWEQWDVADKVFALYEKESHQIPIVKRSIIKYALNCPPSITKAVELVEKARAEDPERVRDIEELLRLEREARARATANAGG